MRKRSIAMLKVCLVRGLLIIDETGVLLFGNIDITEIYQIAAKRKVTCFGDFSSADNSRR